MLEIMNGVPACVGYAVRVAAETMEAGGVVLTQYKRRKTMSHMCCAMVMTNMTHPLRACAATFVTFVFDQLPNLRASADGADGDHRRCVSA